jgi:solute carrier family 45 protein 1/2/4
VAIVIAFVGLAWAPDLMSQEVPSTRKNQFLGKAVAVLSIILLQIAIQPVQVGLRALIIDICPPQQQNQASAWIARMIGVGNILGQLAGSTNIPKRFPFLAKTQLKDVCILSSLLLFLAVTVLCISIKEKDPNDSNLSRQDSRDQGGGFMEVLVTIRKLPKEIMDVWSIQFFSWMGWFPFISYITTFFDDISMSISPFHM